MNKKKIIIIVSAVLLVLAGCAGAAIYFKVIDIDKMMSETTEEPKVTLLEDAQFYPLDEFVVSIPQPSSARFMMVEISLMSRHPDMSEKVEEMNSVIRNTMLQYFSGKTLTDLQKELENIETFQISLKASLITASEKYGNKLPVDQVLLTNVIVQ